MSLWERGYKLGAGKNMADVMGEIVGVFKGFSESGLEFKAEIVVPYHTEFSPLIGGFLIVKVSAEAYLLGRVTKFYPVGVMSGGEAEDYLARLMKTGRQVPEDIKESKLRYNVNVKLLGGLSVTTRGLEFRPSVRKLPHLGAFVGIPTDETTHYICSLGVETKEQAALLGHLALGDSVYNGAGGVPEFQIRFDVRRLVGRRTYVFAHAGYGKSNLIKYMVTQLYASTPGVGLLIFDPEGEYAFTDKKGRPGLADVPELQDKIAVYTDRHVPVKYKRFLAGDLHLNLRDFSSADILSTSVVPEKMEQVWANVVRSLGDHEWAMLVAELKANGYKADATTIQGIVHSTEKSVPQSILNNLVPVVRKLHNENSRMLRGILWHLQQGHIVIVDISLLSSIHGRWVASLILTQIFRRNQNNFLAGTEGELLNVVSVIEEAQTVLSGKREEGESIFLQWAKEGRKYSLGGIFVTQQPGAISGELLSQGENFFVFHLLSAQDLFSLRNANAHFSEDVLSALLNEPIPGNAYFWSAPYQPFVLPMRVLNFETYAATKMAAQKAAVKQTAVEKYSENLPDLETELDKVIREALETDKRVPVFGSLSLDGQAMTAKAAVKLWNLKFNVADSLSHEARNLYTDEMADGKKVLTDTFLEESMRRQKIDFAILQTDADSQPFIVFSTDKLSMHKPPKLEPISFSGD